MSIAGMHSAMRDGGKRKLTSKSSDKHVHFLDIVYQYQLPEEESHDAWLSRFGLWKCAPYHDELWDGDTATFRPRPLTKAELAKENKDAWLRQHFPVSIFIYTLIGKKRPKKKNPRLSDVNEKYMEEEAKARTDLTEEQKMKFIETYGFHQDRMDRKGPPVVHGMDKKAKATLKDQENRRELETMISDEPKKPMQFINKELLERKRQLVEEFIIEEGRTLSAEELEKAVERRLGKAGKEGGLESNDLDSEDADSNRDTVSTVRESSVSNASGFIGDLVRNVLRWSSFGGESVDDIPEDDMNDAEREAHKLEQYDIFAEGLAKLDGLLGTNVSKSPIVESVKQRLIQVYSSLFRGEEEVEKN